MNDVRMDFFDLGKEKKWRIERSNWQQGDHADGMI